MVNTLVQICIYHTRAIVTALLEFLMPLHLVHTIAKAL